MLDPSKGHKKVGFLMGFFLGFPESIFKIEFRLGIVI